MDFLRLYQAAKSADGGIQSAILGGPGTGDAGQNSAIGEFGSEHQVNSSTVLHRRILQPDRELPRQTALRLPFPHIQDLLGEQLVLPLPAQLCQHQHHRISVR